MRIEFVFQNKMQFSSIDVLNKCPLAPIPNLGQNQTPPNQPLPEETQQQQQQQQQQQPEQQQQLQAHHHHHHQMPPHQQPPQQPQVSIRSK